METPFFFPLQHTTNQNMDNTNNLSWDELAVHLCQDTQEPDISFTHAITPRGSMKRVDAITDAFKARMSDTTPLRLIYLVQHDTDLKSIEMKYKNAAWAGWKANDAILENKIVYLAADDWTCTWIEALPKGPGMLVVVLDMGFNLTTHSFTVAMHRLLRHLHHQATDLTQSVAVMAVSTNNTGLWNPGTYGDRAGGRKSVDSLYTMRSRGLVTFHTGIK